MVTTEVKVRIGEFVEKLQALYDADYAKNYPMLMSPLISQDIGGPKYLRIVVTQRNNRDGVVTEGQRSVYCFIDLSNGDILKAEGWKKPAKGKRGSIFNENCDVGVKATIHGGGLYIR